MTPAIGEIVIYRLALRDVGAFPNNGGSECPAVIVRVFEGTHAATVGRVNLRLLNDGPGGYVWMTSVDKGDGPGQWYRRSEVTQPLGVEYDGRRSLAERLRAAFLAGATFMQVEAYADEKNVAKTEAFVVTPTQEEISAAADAYVAAGLVIT